MTTDWEPWPALQRKSNHVVVKLLVLAILAGLSFRLLFSRSDVLHPVPVSPADEAEREASAESMAADVLGLEDDDGGSLSTNLGFSVDEEQVVSKPDRCDLFTGQWIPNPSGPTYTNESCRFIEPPQNCMKNGRHDTGYLFWRWKPHDCDVSPFNAKRFLDTMQNKSWALVGDSIVRNQAQSLICLLSKVEEPVEVYHDEQYKSRKWHFPSYSFNLSLIWSPFLIKAAIFENDEGESKSVNRLHLDTLDQKWTSQYKSFDYVVISSGQWFLKTAIYMENNKLVGCHYCPKLNLSEISIEYAYNKVLNSLYRFIKTSEHKPIVMYRTWTPDHFEYGEWFSGGLCNRTEPYKAGEGSGRDVDNFMRTIELNAFTRAVAAEGTRNGIRLKLLDTYQLSVLRPDAHTGPYRTFHPFEHGKNVKVQYDCLHWCLPGAIDTWNDVMMKLIMDE
ncbi:protein trichome birefringence-like 23 [Zingiber officinale]|uniref:Trichome birefringence-like N-terminal domain-containing protein n=1 Tax=Zingiber officinale TaxID=94328 RepID=A0A8J5HRK2_ZINOF|nr:protein trichome birefringence-like 23 [Zingiber officinale]KAG6534037.1 hypothetical protein ZIOFF_007918 [Zingiber officinale]